MNISSKKKSEIKDPLVILYLGLALIIISRSRTDTWMPSFILFWPLSIVLTVLHELGHALATKLVGWKVRKINIGSGKIIFSLNFIGFPWEIKQTHIGGSTELLRRSVYRYRLKNFFVYLCGPLTHFLLIIFLLLFPHEIIFANLPDTFFSPGTYFCAINFLYLVVNIFPHTFENEGKQIPNDGLLMMKIFSLTSQEIQKRVALDYIIDGHDWHVKGEYIQSIKSFSESIRYDPSLADTFYRRGLSYKEWSRTDAEKSQYAIEDFTQTILIRPDYESAYFSRAAVYCYTGNELAALEDFTKIISLNPCVNSYYNRGVFCYQYDNYELALKDLNQVIDLDTNNVFAYYSRGNVKYRLQDISGSLQDYEKAVSIDLPINAHTEDEHSFYARGIARTRLNDAFGAIDDFRRSEALCLKNGNTHLLQKIRL
jgi:tetratricopeptide (TPR) repeat protein